jgi:hypothetical protein
LLASIALTNPLWLAIGAFGLTVAAMAIRTRRGSRTAMAPEQSRLRRISFKLGVAAAAALLLGVLIRLCSWRSSAAWPAGWPRERSTYMSRNGR